MKLENSGMNKGITLSFQSMNKEVLKNIGRENISIEYYSELMRLYNEAGVATYTELILGLPGETYDSITDGIDELLNLGQHNSIYIHNCEWLPCSIMGRPDYVDRYKIKTSRIPLNQPHREPDDNDYIQEWSQVVTSTYSMNSDEWKKMNLFSYVVQAFHHMGLLQFFALYLYNEGICSYKDFYTSLLDYFMSDEQTLGGKIFSKIDSLLNDVIAEKGTLSCCDDRFGNVQWPFEEYVYLSVIYEIDRFYSEIVAFLSKFNIPESIFPELLNFQKMMMKTPFCEDFTFDCSYNFLEYFNSILNGTHISLINETQKIVINAKRFVNWEMFAKIVAWYGRKDGNTTYIKSALPEKKE